MEGAPAFGILGIREGEKESNALVTVTDHSFKKLEPKTPDTFKPFIYTSLLIRIVLRAYQY